MRERIAAILAALLLLAPQAVRTQAKEVRLPVVMYHHISKNPAQWNDYVISPEEFEDDLRYLSSHGWESVGVRELLAWQTGKTVRFGQVDGEPIVWRVLDEDGRSRLLMAEKPVAFLPYHTERDHTNWSQCSLRRWLNKDFMEHSFTLPERMDILLTPVRNDTDARWKVENGPNTRDKAFVFNQQEMERYYPTPADRKCGQWYWLRGHGWSMLSPMAVYVDGTFYEYGVNKNSDEIGVRPAMWVRKKVL